MCVYISVDLYATSLFCSIRYTMWLTVLHLGLSVEYIRKINTLLLIEADFICMGFTSHSLRWNFWFTSCACSKVEQEQSFIISCPVALRLGAGLSKATGICSQDSYLKQLGKTLSHVSARTSECRLIFSGKTENDSLQDIMFS